MMTPAKNRGTRVVEGGSFSVQLADLRAQGVQQPAATQLSSDPCEYCPEVPHSTDRGLKAATLKYPLFPVNFLLSA